MTTTAGNPPMPVLDVSAALQAAVAAAAEIARVGLPDSLAFATTPLATPVEQPTHAAAAVASPPTITLEHEQSNPHLMSTTTVVAQSQQTRILQQQPYQALQPNILVETRSVESQSPPAVSSDQCTGQDAAGDHKLLLQNDLAAAETSGSSGTGADAAGEKTFEESEEDAAKRLARSRERNREHARRTRLRKKAQLEALQAKVRGLEAEKKALKQKIEECSIASILINLADTNSPDEQQPPQDETTTLLDATIQRQEENQEDTEAKIHLLTAGKRKRFASVDTSEENKAPQTLKLQIDGQTKIIGPKSHINWKSGVYSDENGVQRQLTSEQLEGLRRERNRMHAKMTRDRKKNFIATIEKTIEELERDCQKMRDVLNKVGAHQQVLAAPVTPLTTPRENLPPATLKSEEAATTVLAATVAKVTAAAAAAAVVAPTASALPATSSMPTTSTLITTSSLPTTSSLKTTSSLLSAAAAMAPPKPLLATAVEPAPGNPTKRAKVAHGFSWNG